MNEKLTILIPTFNEEKWISKTLDSIIEQTYQDIRLIIADNQSTDATLDIIEGYINAFEEIEVIQHESNIGAADNIKFLLTKCTSDFFMILGAHDTLEPEFVESHMDSLLRDSRVSLSYSNVNMIDESGGVFRVFEIPKYSILKCFKSEFLLLAVSGGLIPKGVMINHIFRTDSIDIELIQDKPGCDHFFVAFTSTRGRWNKIDKALYNRRYFTERTEDYMKRLTGKEGLVRSDKEMVSFYKDFILNYKNEENWVFKKLAMLIFKAIIYSKLFYHRKLVVYLKLIRFYFRILVNKVGLT